MEVSVAESQGLDNDFIVQLRVGTIRRQAPVDSQRPFVFPTPPEAGCSCRVDVYKALGSGNIQLPHPDSLSERLASTLLLSSPEPGAAKRAVTLKVRRAPEAAAATPLQQSSPQLSQQQLAASQFPLLGNSAIGLQSPSPGANYGRDMQMSSATEGARTYLKRFDLPVVLQDVFKSLLKEQPENPFDFLASRLQAEGEKVQPQPLAPRVSMTICPSGHTLHSIVVAPKEGYSCSICEGKVGKDACVYSCQACEYHRCGPCHEILGSLACPVAVGAAARILACQNALLALETAQLQKELERLQDFCQQNDFTPPPELAATDQTSEKAADLAARNGQLVAQHENLRVRLTTSLLRVAEVLRSRQVAVASSRAQSPRTGLDNNRTSLLGAPVSHKASAEVGGFQCALPFHSEVEAEEEEEEDHTIEPPKEIYRDRGMGISAEAYGAWNRRRAAFVPPLHRKTEEQRAAIVNAFMSSPFFHVPRDILNLVVDTMIMQKMPSDSRILKQGTLGDCLYVVVSGSVDLYDERPEPAELRISFGRGRIFGELAMLHHTPRSLSVFSGKVDRPGTEELVIAKLGRSIYQNLIIRHQMHLREAREQVLRSVRSLDMMSLEQVAQLADVLELSEYEAGEILVRQGDIGDEFFILQSGECSATIATGTTDDEHEADIQEHRRYFTGDLFGEHALLHSGVRAATITALEPSTILSVTRSKFERMFGPLALLQRQFYKMDPRMSIAEFYKPGDKTGPFGACRKNNPGFKFEDVPEEEKTEWFAVYRPTSRDAIGKMLPGLGVGKGLNVKGKSAKKGRISGYVPFLQISVNAHKDVIQTAKPDGRARIFFRNESDRDKVLRRCEPLLDPVTGMHIMGERSIYYLDRYQDTFGLDIPEPILFEIYIKQPDITALSGWETGRKSEPAFMDMNLACLRSNSDPKIVLYQFDVEDPFNSQGLLIAYAEAAVKPVVSDFDTFLVGHRNMDHDSIPADQVALSKWALGHTEEILQNPGPGSWTSRWLEVMKSASEEGFYPRIPKFGLGDSTSYRLIKEVIQATLTTGAVRHGAECFNYVFPQELDDEYLVVWSGFSEEKPWEHMNEDEVRDFLMERMPEGFTFPLNPVWIARDMGWRDIYNQMKETEAGRNAIAAYFPADSGLCEKIEAISDANPDGFLANGTGIGSCTRKSVQMDMCGEERADFAMSWVESSALHKVQIAAKTLARVMMMSKWAANGSDERLRMGEDVDADDQGEKEELILAASVG